MDIPQLKLLAERVRVLLKQSNHPVGHNQSLDLVAALRASQLARSAGLP